MKKSILIVCLFAFLMLPHIGSSVSFLQTSYDSAELPVKLPRNANFVIKVVFINFTASSLNLTYLDWNLPNYTAQSIVIGDINYGVNFTYQYQYVFANASFCKNFTDFLLRIKQLDTRYNPYTDSSISNLFFNANRVEEWLYANSSGFRGFPTNGYTMIVANMTFLGPDEPWVMPHYYNVTFPELDTGVTWPTSWYGRWMTGWGGHYRFFYLDLAAGLWWPWAFGGAAINWTSASNWNVARYYFPPIWGVAKSPVNPGGVDPSTAGGINYITRYVSDFIANTVKNLFTPDFVYPPPLSLNFQVPIIIFDNCTKYNASAPFSGKLGVNTTLIRNAFQDLNPLATWNVTVQYIHLNGITPSDPVIYRKLATVINQNGYTLTDPFGTTYSFVDFYPLYDLLQKNMSQLVTPQPGWRLLPVFVFVFQNGYNLGSEYEGYIYDGIALPSRDSHTLWGIALYDMALVSHSFWDLTTWWWGLTSTIIHELGHQVGLAHPHQHDWVQDFSATAMSYYTYMYNFSQFDKDALQRGHADYYIIGAQAAINNASKELSTREVNATVQQKFNLAVNHLILASSAYLNMNYTKARQLAKEAYDLANQVIADAAQLPLLDVIPPTISDLTYLPGSPTPTDVVKVDVTIVDANTGVKNATLYYKVGSSLTWTPVIMGNPSGDLYNGTILAQKDGDAVTFYIEAFDNRGNRAQTINTTYTVQVADRDPPLISDLSYLPVNPTSQQTVSVNVTVVDAASGVKNVTLYYRVGTEVSWNEVVMTNIFGNVYSATIPAEAADATVTFYIKAYDVQGYMMSTVEGSYVVQSAEVFFNFPTLLLSTGGALVAGLVIGVSIALLIRKSTRQK